MRNRLIAAGLAASAAAMLAGSPAFARDDCQQAKHDDRVTGTVGGAAAGALAGGLIGGDAAGALVGGALGAVGGNVIAGRRAGKCYDYYDRNGRGYYRQNGYRNDANYNNGAYDRRYDRSGYRGSARCEWRDQPYTDAYGNVVSRRVQVCR